MAIDKEAVKEHIRGLLVALGENPDREGLKDTPDRVARMYEEVFEGIGYSNHEIAQMFNKTFEDELEFEDGGQDMVIVKDIDIFSYCEHHLALMYDMKVTVAYLPAGKSHRTEQNRKNCGYGIQKTAAAGENRIGYCGYYYRSNRFRGCSSIN